VVPPVITVPSSLPCQSATGPTGATVTYTVSAVDNLDGSVAVTCNPPSGATFAIGSTTVTCTSSDSANNVATKTFVVKVIDACRMRCRLVRYRCILILALVFCL
jgi:hypothetical protein